MGDYNMHLLEYWIRIEKWLAGIEVRLTPYLIGKLIHNERNFQIVSRLFLAFVAWQDYTATSIIVERMQKSQIVWGEIVRSTYMSVSTKLCLISLNLVAMYFILRLVKTNRFLIDSIVLHLFFFGMGATILLVVSPIVGNTLK